MTAPTSNSEIPRCSHTIGLSAEEWRGFYYQTDTLIVSIGRMCVGNRSVDGVDRGRPRHRVRH